MRFLFRWLHVLACLGLGSIPAWAVEAQGTKVTLQLKWTHQFQFAGYYAALEKGYYRQAGLDVSLREASPSEDSTSVVLSGRAEFGVATSELVLLRAQGKPVVVLAAIFQHSPLALLARRDRGIQSVHDLAGKRIMLVPEEAEILAYLAREGLRPSAYHPLPHSFHIEDLLNGTCDAFAGYTTDDAYAAKKAGLEVLQFSPRSTGIDFYGDCLFTTESQVRDHPERVRAFREASLRGWRYALDHPAEIVDLIQAKYNRQRTQEHLQFEAAETARLIKADLVELGYMHPGRWRHILDTYAEAGLVQSMDALDGFVYASRPRSIPQWVLWLSLGFAALALCATLVALAFLRLNRRLRSQVSQLKRMEGDLQEAKTRFQSLFDHTPECMFFLRSNLGEGLKIEVINPAQAAALGISSESAEGRTVQEIFLGELGPELQKRHAQGLPLGTTERFESSLSGPHGTRRMETLLVPIPNPVKSTLRIAGISRDITDQIINEDAQRHAERLESLGLMAGAIAHDFNNIFQGVMGNLELASLREASDPGQKELLIKCQGALERAAELSRRMLDFSGKGLRDPRPLDLRKLLEGLEERMPRDLAPTTRFQSQSLEAGLRIEGDASQVRQVVEALVLNGLEAVQGTPGLVELRTFMVTIGEQSHREGMWPLLTAPGPKACVEIRDTGPGIARECLEKIFDPFYSTKAHGRGLGLAATLGILRAHGAGVQVLTGPGLGTTMRLFFPMLGSLGEGWTSGAMKAWRPDAAERRSLLIVDDEPDIREVLTDFLKDGLGYQVLSAVDGIEAELLYHRYADQIGLILMDATMPRRGGVETFQVIRAFDPQARALLISGFGESLGQETARAQGFLGFLKKPFRLEDLQKAVESALGTPSAP